MALLAGTGCAAELEAAADAKAQEQSSSSDDVVPSSARRGRIELRRQNSERGTTEESTRTTLRLETYFTGTVSRLRLDLPFPDEKTDFAGDPFQPRPGNIKVRADYRPFGAGASRLSIDTEVTFPTANPASLGTGKYQLGVALHSIPRAPRLALFDHGRGRSVGRRRTRNLQPPARTGGGARVLTASARLLLLALSGLLPPARFRALTQSKTNSTSGLST